MKATMTMVMMVVMMVGCNDIENRTPDADNEDFQLVFPDASSDADSVDTDVGSDVPEEVMDSDTMEETDMVETTEMVDSTDVPCPGQTECGGTCVDTQRDSANCGACDVICGVDQGCSSGACACSDTQEGICGGECVNLQNDQTNCGACGVDCAGNTCGAGQCMCGSTECGVGESCCGANLCVNTDDNQLHCGACNSPCNLANVQIHACTEGSCEIVQCQQGFDNCDGLDSNGCEADLSTEAYCGGCGRDCTSGVCNAGVCTCGGVAVDLTSNPGHCGGCGNVCDLPNAQSHECIDSVCHVEPGGCDTDWHDCEMSDPSDGCDSDWSQDPHCNGCNNDCVSQGAVCQGVGRGCENP